MTLCEKCIHGDVCADRDCMDADDERALKSCIDFKDKADFMEVPCRCEKCKHSVTHTCAITGHKTFFCDYGEKPVVVEPTHYCGYGERRNAE